MAYVNQTSTATLSDRVSSIIQNIRAANARRRTYNQTFRELSGLSDRDLADLGIHRTTIREIAKQAAYGN